jgi:hypothetical protein
MPIPGDNGNPQKERDVQNMRIKQVAERGADVQKEVTLNKPAPKDKCIFGEI